MELEIYVYPVAEVGGKYCKPSTQNGTCNTAGQVPPPGFPEGWPHIPDTEAYPSENIGNATATGDILWLNHKDGSTKIPPGIWKKSPHQT